MEEKEMVLTSELKDKLKKVIGFQIDSKFIYVPKVYRDKSNDIPREVWPKFTLRSKNGLEIAQLEDEAGYVSFNDNSKEGKFIAQSGTSRISTIKTGLLKLENFYLSDGTVFVSWDKDTGKLISRLPDGSEKSQSAIPVTHIIRHMPVDLQREIQNAINERTTLTEEELQGLG